MPTKWLQERPNGSKNVLGIGFEGPGVDSSSLRNAERQRHTARRLSCLNRSIQTKSN